VVQTHFPHSLNADTIAIALRRPCYRPGCLEISSACDDRFRQNKNAVVIINNVKTTRTTDRE
jgi:hypothetical protein